MSRLRTYAPLALAVLVLVLVLGPAQTPPVR
jgi:hypothetical protein